MTSNHPMYRILFALVLLTLTAACRDDFELTAPYADIPVAFAYLDPGQEENFVRVQKAFFGVNGNAELAAQSADSLYYDENEATVSIAINNGDPFVLEQVNGADFGLVRDTGEFAQGPNLLYRLPPELNLVGGRTANLTISRPGETDATASTTILSPLEIRGPSSEVGIVIENYRNLTNIRWVVGQGRPQIYDIRMFIYVREFDANDLDNSEIRRLEFVIATDYEPEDNSNSSVSFPLENERFWRFLGNALEADEDIIRQFQTVDIQVTGVGEEISESINLAEANGGITSAQPLPIYTNLSGGLGIFTSRVVDLSVDLTLDARNNDTLRNGIYTGDLNFQ